MRCETVLVLEKGKLAPKCDMRVKKKTPPPSFIINPFASFLSPPVALHSGLLCIAFLSVCDLTEIH